MTSPECASFHHQQTCSFPPFGPRLLPPVRRDLCCAVEPLAGQGSGFVICEEISKRKHTANHFPGTAAARRPLNFVGRVRLACAAESNTVLPRQTSRTLTSSAQKCSFPVTFTLALGRCSMVNRSLNPIRATRLDRAHSRLRIDLREL